MAESADASDLKSGGGNTVWVQVPSSPPLKNSKIARNSGFFVFVLFFRTNYRTFFHSLYFLVMILSSKISSDGAPYTSEWYSQRTPSGTEIRNIRYIVCESISANQISIISKSKIRMQEIYNCIESCILFCILCCIIRIGYHFANITFRFKY